MVGYSKKTMTVVVAGMLIVSSSRAGFAQSTLSTADLEVLLNRIKAGDGIEVTDSTAVKTAGTLTTLTDTSIGMMVRGSELKFPIADIREIGKRGDSVRNGALIGAGIGAGLVALGGAAWCSGYACSRPFVDTVAASAGVGLLFAGIGALIDKAHTGHTVIYRR